MSAKFLLFVSQSLRFSWVHENVANACGESVGIVFADSNGKETRCHRVTDAVVDSIARAMLQLEDEYLSGSGKVSKEKYERACKRWFAFRGEVEKCRGGGVDVVAGGIGDELPGVAVAIERVKE